MSDISMCLNASCPHRAKCYRATAPVNSYWQTYMDFDVGPDGECKDFIPTTRDEREQNG